MSNSCNVKKSKSTSSKHNCFPCECTELQAWGRKAWLELSIFNGYLIRVGKRGAIPSRGNGEGGGGGGGGLLVNNKLGRSAVTDWLVTLVVESGRCHTVVEIGKFGKEAVHWPTLQSCRDMAPAVGVVQPWGQGRQAGHGSLGTTLEGMADNSHHRWSPAPVRTHL